MERNGFIKYYNKAKIIRLYNLFRLKSLLKDIFIEIFKFMITDLLIIAYEKY
jgi:hypothetical protein